MANFNQLMLLGRLVRDPQLKYLPSNTALAEFTVATSDKYKTKAGESREDKCFTDCKVFGKRAEVIGQYLLKGSMIFVVGKLAQDTWEDKQIGQKRSKHYMKVDDFQFVGGGGGAGSQGDSDGSANDLQDDPPPHRPATRQRQKPPAEKPYSDSDQQFKDDDIPF